MKKIGILVVALGAATLGISVPAQAAIITFATMAPLTADNLYFKNAAVDGKSANASMFSIATPTATSAGSALVGFSFINLNSQLTSAQAFSSARTLSLSPTRCWRAVACSKIP